VLEAQRPPEETLVAEMQHLRAQAPEQMVGAWRLPHARVPWLPPVHSSQTDRAGTVKINRVLQEHNQRLEDRLQHQDAKIIYLWNEHMTVLCAKW